MVKVEVEISEIVEYLGFRQGPLIKGQEVIKAGHIILCQIADINLVKVFALVVRSSAIASPPHEVTLHLKGSVNEWNCVCSCKAGLSGFCKHVVGCLIYINRFAELEPLSCTDITQQWGKEKKELKQIYADTKISELCHPVRKTLKRTFQSHPSVDKANLEIFVNSSLGSALNTFKKKVKLQHSSRYKSQTTVQIDKPSSSTECNPTIHTRVRTISSNNCEEMLNRLIASVNTPNNLLGDFSLNVPESLRPCCKNVLTILGKVDVKEAAIKVRQNTSEWHELRRIRITGSRVYSIFTYCRNDWENKALRYFWPKSFFSKYTAHGKKCEPKALTAFKRENPLVEIFESGFIVAKWPWIGYSPDGIVFENGMPSKLIEIKCPFSGREMSEVEAAEKCDYLVKDGTGAFQLKKKHSHYAQVQLGMAVLNLPQTEFLIYSMLTDNYLSITINLEIDFATSLLRIASQKYFNNMLHVYCENKDEI